MITNETIQKLNEMKLYGMAQGFDNQLTIASSAQLAFEDRFGLIVDEEFTYRDNRRLQKLLKTAKLREMACIEDIDYRADRKLEKSQWASLSLCQWVRQGANVILHGPTGNGKTWLACALGNQACRLGFSVLFQRLSLLLEELAVSHGDGSFRKRLQFLAKFDLLILDDLGVSSLTTINRSDLLEIIEQRSGRKSTLITSQLPTDRWHDYLSAGNPTIADAIMDRIVSGSYNIYIDGKDSMRKLTRKRKTD